MEKAAVASNLLPGLAPLAVIYSVLKGPRVIELKLLEAH